ncbi:uncharacterized protein LOC112554424 isoform X2 [Pomacea canaliculata]|uniref:uncharacterized protein LOC112554424 isoform X2 n=1 Tax=Pomacea canaliculata TaxID=400727 RepID=UPI000D7378A9|nr:uncharacterized protein LOC112554424 isoform X2 [Pomacea canaliculata]
MKQFNDIVTWLKGHISIISLVILGIGNHLVSDDLFCCPCGDDSLRAGYTFSLAFTPAVLLFVLDAPWKSARVSRVFNGCCLCRSCCSCCPCCSCCSSCSSCVPFRRPIMLSIGWIIYCLVEPKFTSCITGTHTCDEGKNENNRKSLITTALAGSVLGLSLCALIGCFLYYARCCSKTILSPQYQQTNISENRGTEDSEEEVVTGYLKGVDWKILSLIVEEDLVGVKLLKELQKNDFKKLEDRLNMGQRNTLRKICEMLNPAAEHQTGQQSVRERHEGPDTSPSINAASNDFDRQARQQSAEESNGEPGTSARDDCETSVKTPRLGIKQS